MSKRANLTLTDSASTELNWLAKVCKRSEASIMCEAVERLAEDVRDMVGKIDIEAAEQDKKVILLTRNIYTV